MQPLSHTHTHTRARACTYAHAHAQEYLLRVNFNLPSVEAEEEVRTDEGEPAGGLMMSFGWGCVLGP